MGAFVLPESNMRWTNSDGDPTTCKLYVYDAGTTDLATIYSSDALSGTLSNPLTSDSQGRFAPVYLAEGDYKIKIETSVGAASVLPTVDGYGVPDLTGTSTLQLTPVTITSNTSVGASDRGKVYQADASGAPGSQITVTADFTALTAGFAFAIVNTGASGSIVIQGSGAETINGSASLTLSSQNAGVGLVSLGATGARVIWNTGGIFTGNLNFTGNLDVDGTLTVGDTATFEASLVQTDQTLTDAANIAWDMSAGNHAHVTLTDNRTLSAPTGETAGQSGFLRVIQDGTGSHTLTWNAAYKFPNGNDEKISGTASSTTLYEYYVRGSDDIIMKKKWVSGRDSIGFWREFTTTPFAVGNGSGSSVIDTAHGLGRYPALVQTYLECDTTDLGYAVGDRIVCDGGIGDGGGSARMLMTIVSTSNVTVLAGSVVPSITRKDTNASGTITAANWTAVSRIYE